MTPRAASSVRAATAASVAYLLLAAASASQHPASGAGERFYRHGIALDGTAVTAVVQGDIRVRSTEMPCMNCHRRSGWGTAEGPVVTPPLTGPALFAPVTRGSAQMGSVRTSGAGTRPAYTEQTLLRALREGVDPAGRSLAATMPRYAVSDDTGAALAAYLRTLSAEPPAGVAAATVHLATITTPGVSAGRRAALLDVLTTYVRHKNAGTRNETGRRERGPWDMAAHAAKYRNWELHEWTLTGAPGGWPVQLADLYRRQPVFAIVGGLGDGDWTPVHEFAERAGVPVVLPQLAWPPADLGGEAFYSMYFSRGLGIEVALLEHQLEGAAARVLQVSRCGTSGHAAAQAMAARVAAVASECIAAGRSLTHAEWARVLSRGPDTVMLWLGPDDLPGAGALSDAVARVFVSSTLLGDGIRALPPAIAPRALVLHPFVLPDELDRHALRALTWLKANALVPSDRGVAINALFAATLVNDAISHPGTLQSREYFIERIEHLASRTPHRSTYPAVTFGPGRRFASAGGYVLKAPSSSGGPFQKVAEWFVTSQ